MISVIMTVYNGARTIRRAIRSVKNQGNVEVELIVVNDGSTDRTSRILQKMQKEMSFTMITQKNLGSGAATNAGLARAHGELIAFLDADDYFVPKALERMQACMLAHGADACVARTGYLLGIVPISNSIECWHKPRKALIDVWEDNFLVEITPAVRAKLFKREVLEGLKFPECKWEDLAVVPAALARAGRVAILDELAYKYRIHLNTTVKDFFCRCGVRSVLAVLDELERNLHSDLNDESHRRTYLSILTLHTVFRMQNVITWIGVDRAEKRQIIAALERQLVDRYPGWREDPVLCDSEWKYKDPFFRTMLSVLYRVYLS